VRKDNGKTVSVAQNISPDDAQMKVGQRVLIQIRGTDGHVGYMRILPLDDAGQKK
jgi:hypothetical protein